MGERERGELMRSCIKTRELTREVQNWIARVVEVRGVA